MQLVVLNNALIKKSAFYYIKGEYMTRSSRQSKILNIISAHDIETQEELVFELRRAGFEVTQATISRDIKELGLLKTQGANGAYRYVTKQAIDKNVSGKLLNVLREAVVSVVTAENLIVVKTIGDSAASVSGTLDGYAMPEVVGVLADRSTVLLVCGSARDAEKAAEKIRGLL